MAKDFEQSDSNTSADKQLEESPPKPLGVPMADTFLLQLRDIVKEEFTVQHAYIDAYDNLPIFVIEFDDQIKERSKRLTERLRVHNLLAVIRRVELYEGTGERNTVIKLVPGPPPRGKSSYTMNIILFIVTLAAVLWAGWIFATSPGFYYIYENFLHLPYDPFIVMLQYTVAILAIIGLHEFGHVFASRAHHIDASLPYFIPGFGYGTFGALIVQRSPPPTRDSLFDLGISGPIVGFIVAIIAVVFGVILSPILSPIQWNELQVFLESIGMPSSSLVSPLLIQIIASIMWMGIPVNYQPIAHPLFLAGWVGCLITGLNYFPIGQLDGGHVSRALFGRKYHQIASIMGVIILFLIGYWFMALIAFFLFYGRHPGPVDDVSPLSTSRKVIGAISYLLPVLCIPPFVFIF